MKDREFDAIQAAQSYQSVVAALSCSELKMVHEEGVRIYVGIALGGGTHVALSPGDDERGAYSYVAVDQFERYRYEFVFIGPDDLIDDDERENATPSVAELQDLRGYLADAVSNEAERLFDRFMHSDQRLTQTD